MSAVLLISPSHHRKVPAVHHLAAVDEVSVLSLSYTHIMRHSIKIDNDQ